MPATTQTAQTLDRGLQVLDVLARTEKGLTISEIAEALSVHRTIAHRLVATLEQRNLVSRGTEGRYRLGAGLIRLAGTINREMRAIARPHLIQLNSETNETVGLAILARADVVYIDFLESPKALRVVTRIGLAYPAHSTSVGKAMLATLDDEAVSALFPGTRLPKVGPKTLDSKAQLLGQLAAIRERGYATNVEEAEEGVASVAVAVIDHHGTTRAAVSVAAPLPRFTTTTVPRLVKAVQRTAEEIGERL